MRIGRDYTNTLVYNYLTDAEKEKVASGELDLSSVCALGVMRAKEDVKGQIKVTKELGISHVELDADAPCPYLNFGPERRRAIKEFAEASDVTLSLHLPYSYVAASICCMQEEERSAAVELLKKYIEFAADVGMKYLVTHPGVAPFYHATGVYLDQVRDALIKSLVELGKFSADRGLALHLENNVASDRIFTEPEDCLKAVQEAREKGAEVYFNFDIGHWFTRADFGKEIPERPESLIETLPAEVLKELHLNDYISGGLFHPLIHEGKGTLKRENLERFAEIAKRKGVEAVVLETAWRSVEQMLEGKELLVAETNYIREIFGV